MTYNGDNKEVMQTLLCAETVKSKLINFYVKQDIVKKEDTNQNKKWFQMSADNIYKQEIDNKNHDYYTPNKELLEAATKEQQELSPELSQELSAKLPPELFPKYQLLKKLTKSQSRKLFIKQFKQDFEKDDDPYLKYKITQQWNTNELNNLLDDKNIRERIKIQIAPKISQLETKLIEKKPDINRNILGGEINTDNIELFKLYNQIIYLYEILMNQNENDKQKLYNYNNKRKDIKDKINPSNETIFGRILIPSSKTVKEKLQAKLQAKTTGRSKNILRQAKWFTLIFNTILQSQEILNNEITTEKNVTKTKKYIQKQNSLIKDIQKYIFEFNRIQGFKDIQDGLLKINELFLQILSLPNDIDKQNQIFTNEIKKLIITLGDEYFDPFSMKIRKYLCINLKKNIQVAIKDTASTTVQNKALKDIRTSFKSLFKYFKTHAKLHVWLRKRQPTYNVYDSIKYIYTTYFEQTNILPENNKLNDILNAINNIICNFSGTIKESTQPQLPRLPKRQKPVKPPPLPPLPPFPKRQERPPVPKKKGKRGGGKVRAQSDKSSKLRVNPYEK